MKSTWGYDKDH